LAKKSSMNIQVKYFQDLPLCTAPFQGKCLEIFNGINAATIDSNDNVYFNRTQYLPKDYEVLSLNIKKGDVIFFDLDRQTALYRLDAFWVNTERVRKIVALMARYDYDAATGGYITADGTGDSVWLPTSDLNNPAFATELGLNPVFSVLELFDSFMSSLFGQAFESLLTSIPPGVWVLGAGYSGYRSYQTLPKGRKTLKSVKPETIGWAAGGGYAAWRAYKSQQKRNNG